ncbi:transcriptional regulator GcvA [Phaeobacter porticola]|uniref:Putative glycine cleavage system transcriptional activator n=1 Tax=Phaeobacter porticola TaxID=1844006 RepID=A0A1L3I8C8_9RHOB|nr:transcriptional regulator GcvA [Phaeobacter porticola]APG48394.1 putative glycine cleavage system transcriptional activator [Phaeobacter porticola]
MSDRLPPLTALRAFEAAARHMSFARAAQELNVTPAALSFQIKSLEEHLGAPVFRRLNRAVELTAAGIALAPGASDGFQALTAAWRAAIRLQDDGALTVTAGPAFTAKWLAPRFYEFARAHPEIDLRFSASLRRVDLMRDDVDVAIRFGYGPYPDVYSMPLPVEWVMPVMTPDMARQYPTVAALKGAPLIHDDSLNFMSPLLDWAAWFQMMGEDFAPTHGARFSNADHAVDAALAGAGVVLGRRALVVKDLDEGRLVAPFRTALTGKARFSFLCQKGAERRPQIIAFRDWILAEIEKTAPVSEGLTIIPVETLA